MDFEKNYLREFGRLNEKQQEAVETIDGPVMVAAGPGTGKTQLLAMRVANILRETDTAAQNILCLTFTDNASQNMTQRMSELFGKEAYRVAVFTFHAFAQSVINQYPEYFFNGAIFEAVDEITRRGMVGEILRGLPHSNVLAATFEDEPIYLDSVISGISDIKRAGLWPEDLERIVAENERFMDAAEPVLAKFFEPAMPRKGAEVAGYMEDFAGLKLPEVEYEFRPALAEVVRQNMATAVELGGGNAKPTTKFITEFRNGFLEKNRRGRWVMRDRARGEKVKALAGVYRQYIAAMSKRRFYDFDDMILRVVTAMELMPELKFNLQERYQYILVDEFQDTNEAQMRILELLTDADLSPNIMTVGDYKQAIFRFQGAEVANMERFAARFGDKLKLVELEYNYRSGEEILAVAEGVIRQNTPLGFMRRLADKLRAWQAGRATTVREVTAADWASELAYVAEDIERQIAAGVAPERVAVIAKYHRDLVDLVPYLRARGVPLQYEREQDVLASPPVKQLVLLARVVTLVARQDLAGANVLLPEVLAQGAWGFSAVELGRLALAGQYKNWLEVMIDGEEKWRAAAERILELAQVAQTKTLEEMLDAVFAIYREWFFGEEKLREAPDEYLTYLANLTGLRRLVREYKGGDDLSLFDFVELIDSYERLGERITVTRRWQAGSRVQLLTAHKAKGLEFDTVYIINGTNENWARSGGGRRGVVWPANLPLAIDDSEDEHLRLFYVAVTRAERQLFITTHKFDEKGKATLPCGYLADAEMERVEVAPAEVMEQIKNLETEWFGAIASEVAELKDLLAPKLEKYKLSPTHLGTFTDLEYGGPQEFLKRHLLQFPEAKAASAGYGTAVHEALQFVHGHMAKEGVMPKVEAVLGHFEAALEREHLARGDYEKYLEKGRGDLAVFVEKFDFRPGQIAERKFSGENVMVDEVRLNGTVDMLVVDKGARTVEVYDYKTGRAHEKWERKTKLHKYRQQLLFYKLLIEGSREFAGYTVTRGVLQFVEPVEREIVSLEIDYGTTGEELERFRKLVGAVWGRIMELELPEMAKYEKSLAGSLGFERDLVREDGGN